MMIQSSNQTLFDAAQALTEEYRKINDLWHKWEGGTYSEWQDYNKPVRDAFDVIMDLSYVIQDQVEKCSKAMEEETLNKGLTKLLQTLRECRDTYNMKNFTEFKRNGSEQALKENASRLFNLLRYAVGLPEGKTILDEFIEKYGYMLPKL